MAIDRHAPPACIRPLTELASPTLQFTADGKQLIAIDADGVRVHRADGGAGAAGDAFGCGGARALAAFGDQVWTITADRLERRSLDGRALGAAIAIDLAGDLRPAFAGVPAAVSSASAPRLWIDDLGTFREIALGDARVVAPFAGRRWFDIARQAGGDRVRLDGVAWQLPSRGHLEAAAAVYDGTAVCLIVAHGDERTAWLSNLAGVLQQRVALPAGELRLAARRGHLAVRDEADAFVVIDLRRARVIHRGGWRAEIGELAIDASGKTIAIRDRDGVHVASLADVGRPIVAVTIEATIEAQIEAPVVEERVVAAPVVEERVIAAPPIVAAPSAHSQSHSHPHPPQLLALEPRATAPAIDAADAGVQLDRELELVGAWALLAIALGWDSRRLCYANESEHPHEHEVAALVGRNFGFAHLQLATAREDAARLAAALAADPQRRGATSAIGALAAELGLSPLAIDILLIAAAPTVWGDAARLYGILANDPGRPIVDEWLVYRVLAATGVDRHRVARELDPRAPLVRSGAIQLGGKRVAPFADLVVDPIIIARLRGERPDLGRHVVARVADRRLDQLELLPAVIADAIAALSRATDAPARIALRGRPSSGRRTLLAALAAEAGRALAVVEATRLPRDPDAFADALRTAMRGAHLAGLLPCIADLDRVAFGERTVEEVVREVLRAHQGPLAITLPADAVAPFDAGHVELAVPALDESARLASWTAALAAAGLAVRDVATLAARYRVGAGTIHRAIAAAIAARPAGDAADADATESIESYIRQTRDARLGIVARRVDRLASWTDLVLPPDVLDSLRELVARVRHRRQVFEQWGLARVMASSRGLTALFQGQPGTGKTLVAGVLARELGLDLYQVDLSKVMSKWIGETERNLATVFDAAQDGQVILLFDEADSLFARRTEVKSSNDRYANLEVNYLLQRLDSFEGIAILTTNNGGSIDPAFKRRLSFQLTFPFPDEETREQLWRVHIPPQVPIGGELVLDKLARKYQLAGGYIRNACLRAAFLAAQEDGPLYQDHLDRAVALEFAELGRLSSGGTIE